MVSLRYRLMQAARRRASQPPLPAGGAPPGSSRVRTGPPRVQLPRGYHLHAGGWGTAPRMPVMRARPVPVEHYRHPAKTDIGPDGIAAPAVFGAGGTATTQVGPAGLGATWSLDQAFVQTSIGVLDPATCELFVGPGATPDWAVSAPIAGGGSQLGLGGVGVSVGEFVIAVWSGGTPGQTARLRVTGTKTVLVT